MEKKVVLPIKGMTCAACAARIEKNLKKNQGISSANVNFAMEKASVEFDPEEITILDIKHIIEKTGYSLDISEIELKISGMTCAACVARIEKNLKKTQGIVDVSVNLVTETAKVKFIDSIIDTNQIIKIIEKTGYGARIKKEVLLKEKDEELIKKKKLLIISAIFSAPLLISMFFHLNPVVQLILASIVQFYPGLQFYRGAYLSLKDKSANMDVLVAMGTTAAYALSLFNVFKGVNYYKFTS